MPKPAASTALAEIVDRFQRDVITCIIGHVTELLTPLGLAAASPTTLPAKRAPGEKRDRKVIAALAERLATYIATHPGQRVEQINAELGLTTVAVKLPLEHLRATKRVRTQGRLRATTYYPVKRAAR
jgi:hypothetical protein